ncbi:hypothetical protein GW17_00031536 [Ensete ventricosum]|nr:hypothetical protein GW17_00031536 [Ensete ventricosum]
MAGRKWQPLAGWLLLAGPCGLAAADWPLRAGRSRSCPLVVTPYGLLPLLAAAPCRGPGRSRPSLVGSQAMAGRPYRGPNRGQPPLHADSMHVAAPPHRQWRSYIPVFRIRMEKMNEVKRPPL